MRRLLAGLLILILSSSALADMKAEVESIGFNNIYRPDCWTPMVVRITPDKSGTFQLQVFQEDLDGDEPIFTQEITLTGSEEGSTAAEQRFWMYFIPQPTHGGLLDVNRGGTLKEINGQLRVMLADSRGKQLQKLPITSTIINLEPPGQNPFASPRGTKMVLAIGDGKSKLIWSEYEKAVGILESVVMVPLQSRDLPEDPRGFEAVDTIIWTNTEAPDPSSPTGERRMRALQKWVRAGGRLVICQPPERDRVLPWGDLLPVVVNEVVDKKDLVPLATFAMPREISKNDPLDPQRSQIARTWIAPPQGYGPTGPFRVGRAEAKPGTVVEDWIEWDPNNKQDRTPYLARMGYGLGTVTWVAQDLGDPAIVQRATLGWPNVWNHILGYNDFALTKINATPEKLTQYWDGGMGVDLYPSMMSGAELSGKSRAFVGLAIIFFVIYWLIAGPGIYLYLLAKARAYASWFAFGAAAIGATAVTVLLVQLVVRGAPELAHVSIVRKAGSDPAVIISRFGLYIPQDGPQEVKLRDTDPAGSSYVTALNKHPKYVADDSSYLSFANYNVPVLQSGSGEPVAVEFPYRSTMRQMQARWTGVMNGGIEGGGNIVDKTNGSISGTLTNGTGRQLRNVYIAFQHPQGLLGNTPEDIVLYLPSWDKGISLTLADEFSAANFVTTRTLLATMPGTTKFGLPEQNMKLRGTLRSDSDGWPGYWYDGMRNSGMGPDQLDDSRQQIKKAFPMLTFFSRLPPVKNQNRIELLRRGQRQLDLGHAIAAGELVVIAEATDTPIPIPLDVEGDKVTGNGTTFYQFVLPLDRSAPLESSDETTTESKETLESALKAPPPGNSANTGASVERNPNTGRRRIGGQPQQQQKQQQQQQQKPLLNPNG